MDLNVENLFCLFCQMELITHCQVVPTAFGQQQLFVGDIIDLSGTHLNPGTYYVYNEHIFNNPDGSTTLFVLMKIFL